MLYQREINDPVLIQFIILYTLNQAKDYVPYNNLINLVLDNCNINFQDFQVALDNLEHTHHVKTFLESEHNEKYKITKKGMNASDLYTPNIPVYIKEPIDNSINELFNTEKVRNSVRSKITRIRKNEYSVECELYYMPARVKRQNVWLCISRMSRISFTKQFLLLLTRNYIILAKIDADMTVISPATATERLLIAPSISPISRAFVVPIAWDAVPIARPFATGSFILKIFKTASAIILPSTPVMIITATVIVCIPPSSSLTPIPIAVVIDFGKSVTYCSCVSPKKYDIKSILPILAKTPASMPINTSFACSLSTDI